MKKILGGVLPYQRDINPKAGKFIAIAKEKSQFLKGEIHAR
jgi:hypothetical protein